MGGRKSTHVHHHHPPGPTLQERVNNVRNKMDLETKDHERYFAECNAKTQQLGQQMKTMNDEFNNSMALIDAQKSKDAAEKDRVLREMENRIQDQIREIDNKLNTLEAAKIDNDSEIKKFELLVSGAKQKNDQYLQNKASEEQLIKAELDKTISMKEDLVNKTETDQENLLNNRALTNESIRRAAAILRDLLWLPEKAVRNQETFATLAKNLDAYISALLLAAEETQDSIDQPSIASSHEDTLRWLDKKLPERVIEDVSRNCFQMQDLIDILQSEEDMKEELPNLTGFNVRRLKRHLDEVKEKEELFKPNVNYQLTRFATHVRQMLMWKEEADKAATELLKQKEAAKLLISN